MLYLDANVFVYATLNQEDIGERARLILKEVQEGKISAATSALTFDELVWAVRKYRNLEDAVSAGQAFLNMPSLELLDVKRDVLSLALGLMTRYRLEPRDSIHLASALLENARVIVSTDKHFDKVKEVKRRNI